jgi:trehalose 6-phosphate phosphatase
LEYLFTAWIKVMEQIRRAKHILFLTDYDGTLTPIEEKPELANMSEYTRRALQNLVRQQRVTVGVISGRALTDLKEKVNVNGIVYAGNHGFEIDGPGMNFVNPISDEIKPFFRMMRQILNLALGTVKGVLIEDKGITMSIHYRQVEEDKTEDVRDIVKRATHGAVASGIVKVVEGKKVYDLKPAVDWDKGKAIRLLMKRYGKGGWQSGLLPIYLGDDITDEDGFRMIEKYGRGITVLVGDARPDSAAQYYLKSHYEVCFFLDKLLEYAQTGFQCEQLSTTSSKLGLL